MSAVMTGVLPTAWDVPLPSALVFHPAKEYPVLVKPFFATVALML